MRGGGDRHLCLGSIPFQNFAFYGHTGLVQSCDDLIISFVKFMKVTRSYMTFKI